MKWKTNKEQKSQWRSSGGQTRKTDLDCGVKTVQARESVQEGDQDVQGLFLVLGRSLTLEQSGCHQTGILRGREIKEQRQPTKDWGQTNSGM